MYQKPPCTANATNLFRAGTSDTHRRIMTKLWSLLFLSLSVSTGWRSSPASPRHPPHAPAAEQKQFDFWVGEWNVTWPGPKTGEISHGTNTVTRILDGCVVQENSPVGTRRPCVEPASPSLPQTQANGNRRGSTTRAAISISSESSKTAR